jgi:hypothetical protein
MWGLLQQYRPSTAPTANDGRGRFRGECHHACGEVTGQSLTDTVEKVCFSNEQNFREALARPYENYIGGHIVRPISNRQPS